MCKIKVSFLIFFALLSLYAFGFAESKPQDPEQQITDFQLAGFENKGKKSWEISGKSANILSNTVNLKDVVGNLYGEPENIKLTADRGDFNKTDGKVHLEQNVLVSTSSGAKLTTDSLNWDRKNQVVSTEDHVNIERDNIIAKALGAIAHPNLKKVSLEKEVQVNIDNPVPPSIEGGEVLRNKIEITCDGPMEVDYQKNVATFNKKVKVETSDAIICSDVMEVYFVQPSQTEHKVSEVNSSAMGSQVDRIKAIGNVTIIRGENISHSEEAIYNASDKKITLSGKPKLVIYTAQDMDIASAK